MVDSRYKNLTNEEYWIKRNEEKTDRYWRKESNVEKYLAQQFRIALEDIRKEVSELYTKYGNEEGLDYQTAMIELNEMELGDYRAKLETLRPQIRATNDPMLIAEYEKLQSLVKLNRLQALISQINARLLPVVNEQQISMDDFLSGTFESNYYETIYQLQKGTGIGVAFTKLNEEAIKGAITEAWADGDMFSNRIWDNKEYLVRELRQTITQGLIRGLSYNKMAKELQSKVDNSFYNSRRLVQTETSRVLESSNIKAYQNSGIVHQYKIVATKDLRTSKICQKMDGKVFDLNEAEISVNSPPFHPFCRTTTISVIDDMNEEEYTQIARGEDGKKYFIPANMTYPEWYEKYVTEGVLQE